MAIRKKNYAVGANYLAQHLRFPHNKNIDFTVPNQTATSSMKRFNTIVISDLHLGEDLSPEATETTRQQIAHAEENLVQFLRFKAQRREAGRPWRLVINGDMIDFMAVIIAPEPGEKASSDEKRFGLSRRPQVAVRQITRVAERHAEFFRALARFMGRGNCVEVIAGNHDTELQFPMVQRAFREVVVNAWASLPESGRAGALSGEELGEALAFHRWFFHEPGVSWIEHGHQYDECCSYEFQLYPRAAGSDDIMLNVDTAGCRYVTNYIAEADPHQQDDWSAGGYVRFGIAMGLRNCLKLMYGYSQFAIKLLAANTRYARSRRDRLRGSEVHRRRLGNLAAERGIEQRALMSIDNLRRRPVVRHLRRLSAVVMADKVAFYGLAVLAALACAAFLSLPWKALGIAASLVGGHLMTRWSGRNRVIDSTMSLELASSRILREVDAQAVVFGHTHNPIAKTNADGTQYFNTGTWVPTAKPGLLGSFCHLVIRPGETRADIRLYQWQAGACRELAAEVVSDAPAPEMRPTPAAVVSELEVA